ncbi:MAG: hypothetical protein PHO10_05405, partial [Gemmiger sp.]|nr:hypothetical protein [Gemmiger sp.]
MNAFAKKCKGLVTRAFTRRNLWLTALLVAQLFFLLGRFASDFGAGKAVDITPDLIVPYASECTNDARGARIENYTGVFATTRWIDLAPGSYQVVINYVNDGGDGAVKFVDDIMPTAQYDSATLPTGRTYTVFSLWMPTHRTDAQLQFSSNGGVMYITGAQMIPTHAYAYVRFLTALAFFALLDWLLLLATHRLAFPIKTVRGRYIALALGGIIAFASLPTLCNYVLYGHDLSIHLARIEGLKAGLLAGLFRERLDPGILNDNGYPC